MTDPKEIIGLLDYSILSGKLEIDIETIVALRTAMDKQIPIEPKDRIHYEYIGDVGKCPYCGADINQTMNYCRACGQAIKWEDEE